MNHSEIPDDLPVPILRSILQDRSQKYFNMLTCIHNLSDQEKEILNSWMIQTDHILSTLPPVTDAEVAFNPQVL